MEFGLILYPASVSLGPTRVSWHTTSSHPFYKPGDETTIAQYLDWVADGHYSAILPDAGLLQLTYDVEGGAVASHRLAYVPCPVTIDAELLQAGEPIADLASIQLESQPRGDVLLRTPLRFDYDLAAASEDHPAAHLTVNKDSCRIACVAPMHPYRFIDFVYKHFYPDLRARRPEWFLEASERLLGEAVMADVHRAAPHVMWRLH
jgi:hypothetical protein